MADKGQYCGDVGGSDATWLKNRELSDSSLDNSGDLESSVSKVEEGCLALGCLGTIAVITGVVYGAYRLYNYCNENGIAF